MTLVRARAVIVLLALALAGLTGSAVGDKPNLGVAIFGVIPDLRPVTAPGQRVPLRIAIDNMNGAADAHRVKLSAVLPNGLKFESADPPPNTVDGSQLVWDIEILPAKALPRLFEVTTQTDANLAVGTTLEVSVAADSAEGNAIPEDSHASLTMYVQKPGPTMVFSGSTVDATLLPADASATFNVTVKNAGNLPAIDARLRITLPKEIDFEKAIPAAESADAQHVTVTFGDLGRGEARSVDITVAPDQTLLQGLLATDRPLTFTFDLGRSEAGTEVSEAHLEVQKRVGSVGPDVAVWLTPEQPADRGNNPIYNIRYANLGNRPAHNVTATMAVSSGLSIVNAAPKPSATRANQRFGGGISEWNIGDVDGGMSGTIRAQIHDASGSESTPVVTAMVTVDGIDTDTSNNTTSIVWRAPSSSTRPESLRDSTLSRGWSLWGWRLLLGLIVIGALAVILRWRRLTRKFAR